jgi:hypothetical protein
MPKHKPTRRPTGKFERKSKTYDRRPGKTNPGKCLLIVCEGAETEPNYFKDLKNYLKITLVEVQIEKRAGAPISLVERTEQLVAQRDKDVRSEVTGSSRYEAVWCVFDVENPNNNPTFADAVRKADRCHFSLAISNPAFEYWYILHFEPTTSPFKDGGEIKNYLRRNHIPGYEEAMPVFKCLLGQTSQAINRSKSILENHPDSGKRFPNPSTYVHQLVEELIEMSPSGREHLLKNPV